MTGPRKILLLTLVHPDFLPPVYATAQVLRDEGFAVDIITYKSLVPSNYNPGTGINIYEVGRYHNQNLLVKVLLRRKFYDLIKEKIRESPSMIISFCSFSFLCANKQRRNVPHAYIALEIDNFPETFMESPLTYLRIRQTFSKVSKADIVATPSIERSAWLAGRSKLRNVPYTIHNTSYYEPNGDRDAYSLLKDILPSHFEDKTVFLYTGRINENYKVKEIVLALDELDDSNAVLVITGFRPRDEYCEQLSEIIAGRKQKKNILLLPLIPREKLVALQDYADIGICFLQELDDQLDTQMAAPNKIGEYIARGLYLLCNNIVYTSQFKNSGVATLIGATTVSEISNGMRDAMDMVKVDGFRDRIHAFYREEFCMQKQLHPIVDFLRISYGGEE